MKLLKITLNLISIVFGIAFLFELRLYITELNRDVTKQMEIVEDHIRQINHGLGIEVANNSLLAFSNYSDVPTKTIEKFSSKKVKCEKYAIFGGQVMTATLCTSFMWKNYYGYSYEKGVYIIREK